MPDTASAPPSGPPPTEIRHRKTGKVLLETPSLSGPNADLRGAQLSGAHLHRAYMWGAELTEADLSNADLSGANLYGADLRRADLRGADLRGARMEGFNIPALLGLLVFTAVILGIGGIAMILRGQGVAIGIFCLVLLLPMGFYGRLMHRSRPFFADTLLDEADLTGALYDVRTRWPKAFVPEEHGAVLSDSPPAEQ